KVEAGGEEETDRDLQLDDLISRLLTLQDLPAAKGEDRAVAEQIEAVLTAADTARKNWKKEREELRKDVEGLRRELGERPGAARDALRRHLQTLRQLLQEPGGERLRGIPHTARNQTEC